MSPSNPARKNKGRQRVDMAKMENRSNLQVTFSKRRAGLFKKASELCTLCGAEAAMVVFSPANKAYCFGHPNAKSVLDKFVVDNNIDDHHPHHLIPGLANARTTQLIIEAHRNSTIRELNLELMQIESTLRAERKCGDELERMRKAGIVQRWFPGSFDKFNYDQLGVLKEAIMEFKKSFDEKVDMDINAYNNTHSITYQNLNQGENPNCKFWPFVAPHSSLLESNDLSHYEHNSLGFIDNGFNNFSHYGQKSLGFSENGCNDLSQYRHKSLGFNENGSNDLSHYVHKSLGFCDNGALGEEGDIIFDHPVHDEAAPVFFMGGGNGGTLSSINGIENEQGGFDESCGLNLGFGGGMF